MRRPTCVLMFLAAACLSAAPSALAQAPVSEADAASRIRDLETAVRALSAQARTAAPNLSAVPEDALRRVGVAPPNPSSPEALNRMLIDLHHAYKDAKAASAPTRSAESNASLQVIDREIHDLLASRDLLKPVSAIMRVGFALADAGESLNTAFERNPHATENTAAAFTEFETKHFADESSVPLDFSMGGRVGFVPVMGIGTRRGSGDPLKLMAYMANGFGWDMNAKLNLHIKMPGELSVVVRAGQSRLPNLTTVFGSGEQAITVDAVQNGTGRWAFAREVGAEFKFFGEDLDVAHFQKSALLPVLALSSGIRYDERFKAEGALAAFDDAPRRWYLRASANLSKVMSRRLDTTEPAEYALRFTVDHDRPWGDSAIPSGTRLLLEADASLLKLIRP